MAMRPLLAFALLLALAVVVPSLLSGREDGDLVVQARKHARADRNAESADLFARALRHTPTLRDEILREYADQLLFSGHASESIPLFHETLEKPALSDLDRERALRSLALAHLWSGDYDRAIEAYEDTLRLLPGDPDLLKNQAEALIGAARSDAQNDRNRRSADRFARAIKLAPERRGELLREYADQLTYSGRAAEAVVLYRELIATKHRGRPTPADLLTAQALALLWSDQQNAAIRVYERVLKLQPEDEDARRHVADAAAAQARRDAKANRNTASAEQFARAIALAPSRRQEWLREYADQLTYSGRAAAAVTLYREIIATQYHGRPTPAELISALALALLRSDQPDAALRVYGRLLKIRPNDAEARQNLAEAMVALARRDAAADLNAAAADRFARALALGPGNRREWLKEYADQLTYSQRGGMAIPLYREILRDFGVAGPQEVETRLSLARALSWTGELSSALAEYEALIERDPENLDARIGRAEVLSWLERHDAAAAELRQIMKIAPDDAEVRRRLARSESYRGRYREAVALAKPLLEADPSDEAAAIIVAESQLWMGRPDSAMKTLNAFPETGLPDSRIEGLRAELLPQRRPSTSINGSYSTQSDDLDIASIHIVQRFSLNDGLTQFGPQYRRVEYDPENGVGVDVNRIGGFFRHRFNDAVEVNSSFFADIQDGARDHTIFTHDTYLTLFPADMWRFDFGASRTTLDNIQSLNLGIHVDTFSGSADFWPTRNTKLTARAAWSDYSDGNERWWVQGEARQRVHSGPDVWIGGRYTKFGFSRRRNNGYFNPKNLQAIEAIFQVHGTLLKDLTYDFYGTAGYEDPDPDSAKFIWSAGAKLRHPVVGGVDVEAGVDHSSSTLGSDSGFERTTIGLGLSARW